MQWKKKQSRRRGISEGKSASGGRENEVLRNIETEIAETRDGMRGKRPCTNLLPIIQNGTDTDGVTFKGTAGVRVLGGRSPTGVLNFAAKAASCADYLPLTSDGKDNHPRGKEVGPGSLVMGLSLL